MDNETSENEFGEKDVGEKMPKVLTVCQYVYAEGSFVQRKLECEIIAVNGRDEERV